MVLLAVILLATAGYYLWGASGRADLQGAHASMRPPTDELDLPPPERPVEAPPMALDRGLGGAFFDGDWEEDEAATEVASMPQMAPSGPPPAGLTPMMSFGALHDADEQATEVMDASSNAELQAALEAARAEEIPNFGDRGGAYFDDDWDDDEAPTAVMTGDMADRYEELLREAESETPAGPGRVVAKKD